MGTALRHRAGVEALDLHGSESVLEIGCGQGVATRLLLSALPRGRVVAVDRSPKMIGALRDRIGEAERLEVHAAPIEKLDLGIRRFDAILAVNVDFNLRLAATWPQLLASMLSSHGRIVLAFQAPSQEKTEQFADRSGRLLEAEGFRVSISFREDGPERVAVISADPL